MPETQTLHQLQTGTVPEATNHTPTITLLLCSSVAALGPLVTARQAEAGGLTGADPGGVNRVTSHPPLKIRNLVFKVRII